MLNLMDNILVVSGYIINIIFNVTVIMIMFNVMKLVWNL